MKQFALKRSIIAFAVGSMLALGNTNAPAQAFEDTRYTRIQLEEDITHLREVLRAMHPNLYAYRSREELEARFDALIEQLPEDANFLDAAVEVQRVLATICDEHTLIDLRQLYRQANLQSKTRYAERMVSTPEGLFLKSTDGEKGEELISVNGRTVKDINAKIRSMISVDGCLGDATFHTSHLSIAEGTLVSSLFGKAGTGGTFEAITRPLKDASSPNKKDKTASRKIGAVSLRALRSRHRFHTSTGQQIELFRLGLPFAGNEFNKLYERNNPGVFRLLPIGDEPYAYVNISHFIGGLAQEESIDWIMHEIVDHNPKHLVLDLSQSPGGSIRAASRLLSYLLPKRHKIVETTYRKELFPPDFADFVQHGGRRSWAERSSSRRFRFARKVGDRYILDRQLSNFNSPKYQGKITVLVSQRTRSAATMVALALQRDRNATIVGSMFRGGTTSSCFAATGSYQLPNTGVRVYIPHTCYVREGPAKGDILVPDIVVDSGKIEARNLLRQIVKRGVDHVLSNP